MARENLTDRSIKAKKRALPGKRHDYADTIVPGLRLRVTDRGHQSFVLMARYPANPKNPTRRTLGDCYIPPKPKKPGDEPPIPPRKLRHGALTLAEARDKARGWLDLIGRGIDPAAEAKRVREENRRRYTFAQARDEHILHHWKRNRLAKAGGRAALEARI